MNLRRWAYCPTCNSFPELFKSSETGWEHEHNELCVLVHRDGTCTNRWEDGTRGVPLDIQERASEDAELYCLECCEFCEWMDVPDLRLVRFDDDMSYWSDPPLFEHKDIVKTIYWYAVIDAGFAMHICSFEPSAWVVPVSARLFEIINGLSWEDPRVEWVEDFLRGSGYPDPDYYGWSVTHKPYIDLCADGWLTPAFVTENTDPEDPHALVDAVGDGLMEYFDCNGDLCIEDYLRLKAQGVVR